MPTNMRARFKEAAKVGSGALAQMAGSVASPNRKQIADLAAKHRLPAIFERETMSKRRLDVLRT